MNTIISTILPVIIGTSITIGAFSLRTSDIMDSAWAAANLANRHEIRTALELYYLDNGSYPKVDNAPELFTALVEGGYMEGKPANQEAFDYTYDGGEKYKFAIKTGQPQ